MEFNLSQPAPQQTAQVRRGMRPAARNWFLVVLLLVFLFLVFFFLNFQRVVVRGISMYPTFEPNQRILVCKALWLVGQPKKGDLVVLKRQEESEYLVKRVAFIAGETVDRSLQPEKWSFVDGPYIVPEGHIFVLGDNLSNSEDSRSFGAVPLSTVLGKVVGR